MSGVRALMRSKSGSVELDAGFLRNRQQMQHGVGRSAGRGDDRDRVLDRLARDDVARPASELRRASRPARRPPCRPAPSAGSVAGTLPLPSTAMPSVSQTIAIVLAVN